MSRCEDYSAEVRVYSCCCVRRGRLTSGDSTVGRSSASEVYRSHSLHFLGAPVSGSQAGAVNGALTVMCGGDAAPFETMKPVAMAYAKAVTLVGTCGAGPLDKMVNQHGIGRLGPGSSQAIPFGLRAGPDRDGRTGAQREGWKAGGY